MPFQSQQQWKWAFATNQDFAKRWAKETPGGKRKFLKLAKKVGFKSAIDSYAGTTATMKAPREFVRDDSGKFSEKPGGGSDKVSRTIEQVGRQSSGGGGSKRTPKKTQAQRAAERATKTRDNAMTVLDQIGFDASDYELLDTDSAQDANDPSVQRLLDKGLMERVGDKIYVSPLGKNVMSAAGAGNADKAQQAIDRANVKRAERDAKQAERDAKQAERDAKQAERDAKKKKGGGGSKKPAKPANDKPAKPAKSNTAKIKKIDGQIAKLERQLERESDGEKATSIKNQINKLRGTRDKLSTTKSVYKSTGHVPPAGVREAATRGLQLRSEFGRGGTAVGIARARDLSNGKRINDSTIKRMNSFFARHAVDKRPGWSDPANPTNGYIAHLLWGGDAGKSWARKIGRQLKMATMKASVPTNPDLWKRAVNAAKRRYSVYPSRYANYYASAWYEARGGKWKNKKESSNNMMVYKSREGQYRWVAISATAFRDRDKEIISTKALRNAVEKSAESGNFGPLRFWHVPGMEIGSTDFQALSDNGRFLIESGLIYDNAIGDALMKRGHGWQMSIGFVNKSNEPDNDGVYHHINIFERSITPPGMSANPLTAIMVGE